MSTTLSVQPSKLSTVKALRVRRHAIVACATLVVGATVTAHATRTCRAHGDRVRVASRRRRARIRNTKRVTAEAAAGSSALAAITSKATVATLRLTPVVVATGTRIASCATRFAWGASSAIATIGSRQHAFRQAHAGTYAQQPNAAAASATT